MRNCPFCGARPIRLKIVGKLAGDGGGRKRIGYVKCLDCKARGPKVEYWGDGSEVTLFGIRSDAVPEEVKAECAVACEAVRAWDACAPDPEEFRLE